jgi:hypothetical protein
MKLPHGLSPLWLSIPATIFVLVIVFLVARLPVFRAATIQNPEGEKIILPTPASINNIPDSLNNIRIQLNEFDILTNSMQIPAMDRQISLPID